MDQLDPLLATAGGSIADSPAAPLAFFAGWALIGLLVSHVLAARGHDRRLITPVAIGLGPLMLLLARDVIDEERGAQPIELDRGVDRKGTIDVLVWVQGRPEDVVSVIPDLQGLATTIRTLTFARAVPYEWVEEGPEGEELAPLRRDLETARALAQSPDATLLVFPGRIHAATVSFRAGSARTLVLHARGDADDSDLSDDVA